MEFYSSFLISDGIKTVSMVVLTSQQSISWTLLLQTGIRGIKLTENTVVIKIIQVYCQNVPKQLMNKQLITLTIFLIVFFLSLSLSPSLSMSVSDFLSLPIPLFWPLSLSVFLSALLNNRSCFFFSS